MDGARFDALARTLSRESKRSRRGVLRTAAGGVLVGLWGAVPGSERAAAQIPPPLCPEWVLARYPWLCEANEPNNPNNTNNRNDDDDNKDESKDEKKDKDKTCPATCPVCQKCDAATGQCMNVANGTGCDDGNVCTVEDACTDGVCQGTPVSCPPTQICCPEGTPGAGTCRYPNGSSLCFVGSECCSGTCPAAFIGCV